MTWSVTRRGSCARLSAVLVGVGVASFGWLGQDELDVIYGTMGELLGEYGGTRGWESTWRVFAQLAPYASPGVRRLFTAVEDAGRCALQGEVDRAAAAREAAADRRSSPDPITGLPGVPLTADGATDWPRFAGELLARRRSHGHVEQEDGR